LEWERPPPRISCAEKIRLDDFFPYHPGFHPPRANLARLGEWSISQAERAELASGCAWWEVCSHFRCAGHPKTWIVGSGCPDMSGEPMLAPSGLWPYLLHVSKQRPSKIVSRRPAIALKLSATGFQAAYWRRRLYKNTFTRDGQRTTLKGWSVKIQHAGRRRTFSLTAANRAEAAREAWQIYQTIVSPPQDMMARRTAGVNADPISVPSKVSLKPLVVKDVGYWKPRLLHRKYLECAQAGATEEFSVRVEHAGTSHYFRLGTSNEKRAAAQAAKIHRMVIRQGWEAANERFRRELTVAFRWADNPVAWTYTTIHTPTPAGRVPPVAAPAHRTPQLNVAVVESDAGIRHTLACSITHQDEFCCIATFANFTEALRWLIRWQIRLVLVNQNLTGTPGNEGLEALTTVAPGVASLRYSVYEDSDQLFTSVPGGVAGYLLKRTPPNRILEPVADTLGKGILTREEMAICVQQYFQRVLPPLPKNGGAHEVSQLTHREHEVLALLSKGYLDKEIADSLRISIWTVHGHVKNIFEKLNVHSRTGAVVKFLQK
jgi:DNA-binding NarL/FixJ family response regulator